MEIIGVLDIRGARAVHAVAGRRERYAPVASAAGAAVEGDAAALAHVYVDRLGIRELYVADLGAIVDGRRHDAVIRTISTCGAPLWVDAGVRSADVARDVLASGAHRVVVGLETLPSWAALESIVDAIGGDRVVFSLDLRDGHPVCPASLDDADMSPVRVVERASRAGAGTIVVLDLARVGGSSGLDIDLLRRIRRAVPGVRLAAGGGVRDAGDLECLAAAGCEAALVATALHDGRLDAATIAAARAGSYRSASR